VKLKVEEEIKIKNILLNVDVGFREGKRKG